MNKNATIVRARRFLKCTRGANLVEYIILVGVVSVMCLFVFSTFGKTVKAKITGQNSAIQSTVPGESEQ